MSKVSTKDAVISFETAFNFLQQGDLEIDCKEFKPFKPLKKVKLLDNTTKYYILFQQIIFISVCIIHLFISVFSLLIYCTTPNLSITNTK